MPSNQNEPELRRLREWCGENDIPISTAYEKIKQYGLELVKVGRGTYAPRRTREFLLSGSALQVSRKVA